MTYKVYKITNLINSKIYVGITKSLLSHRFWEHCNHPHSAGSYLHRSIKRYGKENFQIDLLFTFDNSQDSKNKERELIDLWQLNKHKFPNGNGMNLTDGGDGSYGCKHTQESIAKMSGKNNHNYGLFGEANPTSKTIHQFTKQKDFIQTFGSIREAARFLFPDETDNNKKMISVSSNIVTSIKNNKNAYGFKWSFDLDSSS